MTVNTIVRIHQIFVPSILNVKLDPIKIPLKCSLYLNIYLSISWGFFPVTGAPRQASHRLSCTTFNSAGSFPLKDEPGTLLLVSNKISSPGRSMLASKSAENDVPDEWQLSRKTDMGLSQRKSPLKRQKTAYGYSLSQPITILESK